MQKIKASTWINSLRKLQLTVTPLKNEENNRLLKFKFDLDLD